MLVKGPVLEDETACLRPAVCIYMSSACSAAEQRVGTEGVFAVNSIPLSGAARAVLCGNNVFAL